MAASKCGGGLDERDRGLWGDERRQRDRGRHGRTDMWQQPGNGRGRLVPGRHQEDRPHRVGTHTDQDERQQLTHCVPRECAP